MNTIRGNYGVTESISNRGSFGAVYKCFTEGGFGAVFRVNFFYLAMAFKIVPFEF